MQPLLWNDLPHSHFTMSLLQPFSRRQLLYISFLNWFLLVPSASSLATLWQPAACSASLPRRFGPLSPPSESQPPVAAKEKKTLTFEGGAQATPLARLHIFPARCPIPSLDLAGTRSRPWSIPDQKPY